MTLVVSGDTTTTTTPPTTPPTSAPAAPHLPVTGLALLFLLVLAAALVATGALLVRTGRSRLAGPSTLRSLS